MSTCATNPDRSLLLAYLFGATRVTADGTVRWKLELEVPL
jgi:hypothetical protein